MGFRLRPRTFTVDATGVTVNHAYGTFGSRTVALRVTDNNVPAKTDLVTHVITSARATLAGGGPGRSVSGGRGDSLALDGGGSSDPDAACGDAIVSYRWDLGADGSYEYIGATLTVPWSALSGLPQPGMAIPVRLQVTDTFGARGRYRRHDPADLQQRAGGGVHGRSEPVGLQSVGQL